MALNKKSEHFEDAKVFKTIDPMYNEWWIESRKYYIEKEALMRELNTVH